MSNTGQAGPLNFTAKLDINQAKKNAEELKKTLSDLAVTTLGITKLSDSQKSAVDALTDAVKANTDARKKQVSVDNNAGKALTEYQKKQLELRKILIDAQATSEDLRRKNLELDASYKAGKITAQELAAAEKQARKDRLALAEATKAARQAQVAAIGSYDEANARLKELGRSIKSAAGGFDSTNPIIRAQIAEYNKLNQSLKDFDDLMGNHQRHVGDYKRALSGVGDDLKALALNYLSLYGALAAVTYEIKLNAEISDSLSDVRRTAGLTADEVNDLAEALKKIDTRTSLKGLLEIATIGGQLGISKDQLGGFTKAVDELAVSLSGELQGGAEGIAKSLGVLDNVFGVTKSNAGDVEKSYNQIGSAILGLGQSGLATGDFLTDFGERVGGLAKQAKLSLPIILSYGAVLQENGVSAEVAGSSFKRLLSSLTTNRTKFFAIAQLADANLTLNEFTRIINTDTKRALDLFFAGLEKGGTTTTSFNDILKSLKLTGPGVSQTIAALAGHQLDLNEHIQEAIKYYNDGALSAEQFEIKNDNLAGSVSKLSNEFDNALQGDGVGKFFKNIVDGARYALIEIDKLFKSRSLAELSARVFTFDASFYDKKNYISDNFNASKTVGDDFGKNSNPTGASRPIVVSALADKPVKELSDMVSQYKKAAQQAATALISYQKGIDSGDLKDGGDISLDAAKKNYTNLKNVLGIVRDAYDQAKSKSKEAAKGQIQDAKEIADSELKTADAIRARIKELQNDALANPANKAADVKRIQDLKETLRSVAGNPESESKVKSELKARNDLQSRIDELTKKGIDKQLSSDEQEVESVKDKYKKMLDAVKAFNNDPENKKKGLKVDGSGLAYAQDRAVTAVEDKQAADKLKVTFDQQKKLYDDYEAYKLKVGKENADKYYADQIDTDKTYIEYLKAKRQELANADSKSKGGSDVDNAAVQEQLKVVDKEIAEEIIANKKKDSEIYANSYQAALTNAQALLEIETDYQIKVKALGENASQEQIDNLKRQRDQRIKNENESNADQLSGYADLLEQIDGLTREQAISELEQAKDKYTKQYKDGAIKAKFYFDRIREINSRVDQYTRDGIFSGLSNAIKNYKEAKKAFDNASGDTGKKIAVEDARADLFNKIAEGAEVAAQAVQGVGEVFDSLGVGGDKLQTTLKSVSGMVSGAGQFAKGYATGNPIDMISGSVKFLTSAISLFSHKDADLQKKIDGYKKELDQLGAAYKQLDQQVKNAVGEDIYTDQAAQIKNLQQQQIKLTQMRDAEAQKKKADQGKIDDYNNQISDIPNKIDDINKAISQNLIQTTFKDLSKSLSDAFSEAFASGEDSAGRFEDVFNQVIANAVKNSLQLKLLDPIISDFTDDLTQYAKDHDNSVIGFDFDTWKKAIKEKGDLYTQGLEAIKDYLPDPNDSSSSSAKGQIEASITEDTATRLYGVFAGTQTGVLQVRDEMKSLSASLAQSFLLARDHLNVTVQIEANTRRGADNTDGLIPALKEIINNTKSTNSLRGSGLQ
ncbi:phage tail tape measure protein [Mucilaginibacter endophyticus]|uniref:phage tail tape measure protein n=1 Tax=Mucilaginibacter endophyticus TaxID=2675003 RepID=UPI000E0DDDDD|nr:phage tail tape measure protein [Mucilaginibacter endophyticus]